MTPAQILTANAVSRFAGSTAAELWHNIRFLAETKDDHRALRVEFPEQDQSMRNMLAGLEKAGKVKHTIRKGSILKEWWAA